VIRLRGVIATSDAAVAIAELASEVAICDALTFGPMSMMKAVMTVVMMGVMIREVKGARVHIANRFTRRPIPSLMGRRVLMLIDFTLTKILSHRAGKNLLAA
jgi:hypothetical protein